MLVTFFKRNYLFKMWVLYKIIKLRDALRLYA